MLQLRIRAPFGAFRTFTAGAYRPTAPTLTPSAGFGVLLNLAGIESRWDDGKSAMTLMRDDLPAVEVAIGAITTPEVHTAYQQLHNYPVGEQGKERLATCKGNKYNIQPVRREFLSGLDLYLCCRGNSDVEEQARRTLRGSAPREEPRRYGLPFLGDNSFMIDCLVEVDRPEVPARWLRPLLAEESQSGSGRMRLSVLIDRADMRRTRDRLYVWSAESSPLPPDDCWTKIAKDLRD